MNEGVFDRENADNKGIIMGNEMMLASYDRKRNEDKGNGE